MSVVAIDFVVPDLFGPSGGIARIARAMSLALCHWADARGIELHVHALMDEGGRHKLEYLPRPHHYHAYRGGRIALSRALLRRVWSSMGERIVVYAHPNLAVTSLAFPPWVKCAVVAHGVDVWSRLRVERRAALHRVDALWPVSEDTARHLRELQGIGAEKINVIPNALDPYWPLPETPSGAAAHLLSVCRLHPDHAYKGIDLTLQALARLPAERRLAYVIAGDGPDRPRLERLAEQLELDTVRFAGRVSDATLTELYRDARAFVLPSTGEGFGLVYLEAMAFGLPCVAAKAGGATEVVADGVTGITIAPGDVAELAEAIERVSGEQGRGYGLAGRERVEREFLFPRYAARVHGALDALIKRGRAAGGATRDS